jgi:hypothetical protein
MAIKRSFGIIFKKKGSSKFPNIRVKSLAFLAPN